MAAKQWPEEKTQELIEMWRANVHIADIQLRLRMGEEKVRGKIRRLKEAGVLKARERVRARGVLGHNGHNGRAAIPHAPILKRPRGKLIRPADIRSDQCRWPEGDPREKGFGFCGHPQVAGRPYCAHHADRAYAGRTVLKL